MNKKIYTEEEIQHYCDGFECVYQVYQNNTYWKYKGIIRTIYHGTLVVMRKEDGSGEIVKISNILSIPFYDACKGSKLLKLVIGDISNV
jgi:hypothetical protein